MTNEYTNVLVFRNDEKRQTRIFPTLQIARHFVMDHYGWKIDYEALSPDIWRNREAAKFASGEYKSLPKNIQEILNRYPVEKTNFHFVHVPKDGENIAYIPDHSYGVLNRIVKVKIGRYIQHFYATEYPSVFTESKIREISDMFSTAQAGNVEMRIGNTREDFRFAYSGQPVKSPSSGHISCMAGKTGPGEEFRSLECHPAEVYAGGDLSIAILFNPTNPEVVLARSIIYPAKKTHCKVYSLDHRSSLALSDKLRALKYNYEEEKYGARLLKIPCAKYGADNYIMPYIDGENYAKFSSDGTHFILASSGYETDNTGGTMYTGHDRDSSEDDDDDEY